MLLGDPRQSDQRTQSFHFPIVVHQSLDPAAQSSAQAPSFLSLHALWSSSARQARLYDNSAKDKSTKVRSQQCECQQCERVNSANETRVRMSNVRMPTVRCDIGAKKVRQQCEWQQCEKDIVPWHACTALPTKARVLGSSKPLFSPNNINRFPNRNLTEIPLPKP